MPKQLDLQELLEFQKEAYRHDYKLMCQILELISIEAPIPQILALGEQCLSDNVASRSIRLILDKQYG